MKAILVIIAVVLAIPTYGLSLVALVGIVWYIGKVNNYESSKRASYNNLNEAVQKGEYREVQGESAHDLNALLDSEDFWYPIRGVCQSGGVSPILIRSLTEQSSYLDIFFRPLLSSGINRGLSVKELQMLASDFISDFWNALSLSQKRHVIQSHNRGDLYVDFDVLGEK